MFQLSNLTSSGKKRKRIGRGGSRGGTSGRGTKGQKARSGSHNRPAHFEGGQMPLVRRLPKRGFNNARFADRHDIVNLGQLEIWFEDGAEVSSVVLHELGYLKGASVAPLKVLAKGSLTKKLIVHADAVSAAAAQMIASCGGEVRLIKGED
jgi:large subunit ribosomal protein L15